MAEEGICFRPISQAVQQDHARKERVVTLRQPRGGLAQVTLVPARAGQHGQFLHQRRLFLDGRGYQVRTFFSQFFPEQPRSRPDARENRKRLPVVGRTGLSEPRQHAEFFSVRQSSQCQSDLELDARVGVLRKREHGVLEFLYPAG